MLFEFSGLIQVNPGRRSCVEQSTERTVPCPHLQAHGGPHDETPQARPARHPSGNTMKSALLSPLPATAARAVAVLGIAALCTACAVPAGYDDGYGYPAYPQGSVNTTIIGGQPAYPAYPTYIYERDEWAARERERAYWQRQREREAWQRQQQREQDRQIREQQRMQEQQRREWERQQQQNRRDQEQMRRDQERMQQDRDRGQQQRDQERQRWQQQRQQDQDRQQQQNERLQQWRQQRDWR